MFSALDRKALRDIWNMKGQMIAICLVIASGIATWVLMSANVHSLQSALDSFYAQNRFSEVFVSLRRAPRYVADRIQEIPGVARVQPRVVEGMTLDIPGLDEPAIGQLVSMPGDNDLNSLYLRVGRLPEPGRPGEVAVSEGFASAHGYRPGDSVLAVMNGRRQKLVMVGIALSPEYIYQIQPGDILPDDKRFGVFWMDEEQIAAAFDMEGAFNNLTLTLQPGAVVPDVLSRVDRMTETYGGMGAYTRENQYSHLMISDELYQLHAMGFVPPAIFLSVAAFLLNVVLSRLVQTQREQIAALKAFGYSNVSIGVHYFKMVGWIVFIGVVTGTIAGGYMGNSMSKMYKEFFKFPDLPYFVPVSSVLLAFAFSAAAGAVGVWGAVRRAVSLPPAEAMRPEAPATFKATLAERLGLSWLLSQPVRMVLRQIERRPFKSLATCVGVALSVAVLVLGAYMEDTIDFIMDFQFYHSRQHDLEVSFIEASPIDALNDLRQLPGVKECEPVRSVPARLHFRNRSRRLGIMGLPEDCRLVRPMNQDLQPKEPPRSGLLISLQLAMALGARAGDEVTLEVLDGARPVRTTHVSAVIVDFLGSSAYMELDALNRLLRDGDLITGASLTADARHRDALYDRLKHAPRVANVTVKNAAILSFREMLAEQLLLMRTFNIIFSSIIAFGVVYNGARITLSERSRELATLRVMGFTVREISMLLLGEVAVLTVAAIPLGLFMGYGFAAFTTEYMATETRRFPLIIDASTFGWAVVVVLIASFLSGIVVQRRLKYLNLIAVLKSSE